MIDISNELNSGVPDIVPVLLENMLQNGFIEDDSFRVIPEIYAKCTEVCFAVKEYGEIVYNHYENPTDRYLPLLMSFYMGYCAVLFYKNNKKDDMSNLELKLAGSDELVDIFENIKEMAGISDKEEENFSRKVFATSKIIPFLESNYRDPRLTQDRYLSSLKAMYSAGIVKGLDDDPLIDNIVLISRM